jgi:hypothetical protein
MHPGHLPGLLEVCRAAGSASCRLGLHRLQFAEYRCQNRRKLYPAALRDTLERGHLLRIAADYREDLVSRVQAER